jgi:uncharacterized protein YhfF
MWPRLGGLRTLQLGTVGEMRDRLNALVKSGAKTATGGPWRAEYEADGEEIETVGERLVLVDSGGARIAIVEVARVESHRFVDVPWEFARDEGEGFTSIEDWRLGYRSYYQRTGLSLEDDEPMICLWIRMVEPS